MGVIKAINKEIKVLISHDYPSAAVSDLHAQVLTLAMRKLLSAKAKGCKDLQKPSKSCHIGIHWIALAEYSQMSTHLPGLSDFSGFLYYFVLAKLATASILKS